jgi:hypothetical protein
MKHKITCTEANLPPHMRTALADMRAGKRRKAPAPTPSRVRSISCALRGLIETAWAKGYPTISALILSMRMLRLCAPAGRGLGRIAALRPLHGRRNGLGQSKHTERLTPCRGTSCRTALACNAFNCGKAPCRRHKAL